MRVRRLAVSTVAGALAGCSQAPAYDVMGSLFPAWLICIAVGVLLAAASRWALGRVGVSVAAPVLVYPSLAAAFTFAMWLVFFR